jgi:hypothetical protein
MEENTSLGHGSPGSILPPTIPEHHPPLYNGRSRRGRAMMKDNTYPRSTPSHNTFHFPALKILRHSTINPVPSNGGIPAGRNTYNCCIGPKPSKHGLQPHRTGTFGNAGIDKLCERGSNMQSTGG